MSKKCCNSTGGQDSSGVIDDKSITEDSLETFFNVKGMDCADEVSAIQRAVKHSSIFKVDVNLMNESVTVFHLPSLSISEISKMIESTGVKIVQEKGQSFLAGHKKQISFISASCFFLILGFIAEWKELWPINGLISIYSISILLSGYLIFPKAMRALRKFSLDMNVLMSVAVVGAYFIKEYSEAATVVFLFSFAEMLEALSVARARKAIREVLKITPKMAMTISPDGSMLSKEVSSIQPEEIILIRSGENVPLDGVIIEGESNFNQAALTGESIPVHKVKGDNILAGTLNEFGAVKMQVKSSFKDSKVSKIISLIENAQNQKAPSQRFVDKFSKIYTPTILGLALVVAFIFPLIFNQSSDVWVYRALVLLVIGCPCALVIATPVSVVSGLTSLARRGVLVKGGVFLETLGQIKAIALDKTGTITEGKPKVLAVKTFSSLDENELLKIVASIESMTTHPLASAIIDFANEKGVKPISVNNYLHVNGRGAEGTVEGHDYFVGNHKFAHELGVCTPELENYLNSAELEGFSVVVVGHKIHHDCSGEILAVITVGDSFRDGIKETIQSFHMSGVQKVVLLSGDNQKTVNAVAKEVGIDYAKGALLPDQKVTEVKDLVSKYHYVGMVGDGVNDAPALANASVGIAMGVAGTDTAIETADIALMKDDLSELPKAIVHGRRVLSVIRFNIAFAISLKLVFLVLAVSGFSSLWLAVVADTGASILVTFNALRLLSQKK